MIVYYLNEEYEAGKHRIVKVWSEKYVEPKPEENPKTAINDPYSFLVIDEEYNRMLCKGLLHNTDINQRIPDKYYIGNDGKVYDRFDVLVPIIDNPQTKEYKLSILFNATNQQIDNYIDANVTTIATARTFLKKLTKIVVLLARHSRIE